MSNEEIEAEMLERAATAVDNLIAQQPARSEWAQWVPQHLRQLAAQRVSSSPEGEKK